MDGSGESLHRRAGPVGGKGKHCGRALELPAPVFQVLLQHCALEPLALPEGEVPILDRQVRQRRCLTMRKGFIEFNKFTVEDAHRPAIGDYMVHA